MQSGSVTCLVCPTASLLILPTDTTVMIAIFTARVEIRVTDENKHSLPVDPLCPWQHPSGLAKREVGCSSADGSPLKNYFDIWLCMEQAACTINGALDCSEVDVRPKDTSERQ